MNSQSTRLPWQEMRRLQRQMEQLIGGLSPALGWPPAANDPPINITRAGDHLIVDALCPGVDKETIDVTVVGTAITLHGDRRRPADADQAIHHRRERPQGAFTRSFSLNDRVDPDSASATYRNGILSVRLKRAGDPPPKKITINQ